MYRLNPNQLQVIVMDQTMISDPTQGPIREELPHEDNLYTLNAIGE